MIKGQNIILYNRTLTGTDPIGEPVYEETAEEIQNVLIEPVSSDDRKEDFDLYGIATVYRLRFPKGDNHILTHRKVRFYGQDWQTIGEPAQYLEGMTPGEWNKYVEVAHYAENNNQD